MATVKLFLIESKRDTSQSYIYARVFHGKEFQQKLKLKYTTDPEHWSKSTGLLKPRYDEFNRNEELKKLKRYIEDALVDVRDFSNMPKDWLRKIVERFYAGKSHKISPDDESQEISLFEYIESFISRGKNQINPKTGKRVSYRVYRDYIRTYNLLKEYSKNKPLQFKDIDLSFYDNFLSFLQSKNIGSVDRPKHYTINTVGKYIKNLKIFLNSATEQGYNTNLKYKSNKFVKLAVSTDNIYFDESELTQIYELDLSKLPGKEKVRDLFIVGCYTGLRFSDLSRVTNENIKDGMIFIQQQKTGDDVVVPLHPIVKEIILKYDNNLPPAISNQKTNAALKKICKLAEINTPVKVSEIRGGVKSTNTFPKYELVSTHTARRSFATNLYKKGFPSQSIMKITGHKSESAFKEYIKVTPAEHAELLAKFWSTYTS